MKYRGGHLAISLVVEGAITRNLDGAALRQRLSHLTRPRQRGFGRPASRAVRTAGSSAK